MHSRRQRTITIFALLAAALEFTSATQASAQHDTKDNAQALASAPKGKPQTVPVDLKRLGNELNLYAAEANRKRWATALTGLGVGLAMVPAGLVLLGRTDGVSRALVIGMIVGGSAQLLSVPFGLLSTRMDEIREDFMRQPTSHESKATIREVETEWRLAAENSRHKRTYVGSGMLIVGSLSLGVGLGLMLAHEGVFGMGRKAQYIVGGVMMGTGVSVTTLGVRSVLEWSLEEISWEAYRTMKSDASSLARLRSPMIAAVPIPGGAMAVATLCF